MKCTSKLLLLGIILFALLCFVAGIRHEKNITERELSHYPLTVINYTPEDNVIERKQPDK